MFNILTLFYFSSSSFLYITVYRQYNVSTIRPQHFFSVLKQSKEAEGRDKVIMSIFDTNKVFY